VQVRVVDPQRCRSTTNSVRSCSLSRRRNHSTATATHHKQLPSIEDRGPTDRPHALHSAAVPLAGFDQVTPRASTR